MRRLAFILLFAVAAGCGGDKSTAPKRIEGTYALKTINGSPPPLTIYDDTTTHQRIEVLASSLTINAGGSFSSPWSFRITDNGTVSPYAETCTGTFTRTGNSLSITETDNGGFCGGSRTATWDGNDAISEGLVVFSR